MNALLLFQEDTSEFLNGLLTALEHVSLCQAGGATTLDARSKVPLHHSSKGSSCHQHTA